MNTKSNLVVKVFGWSYEMTSDGKCVGGAGG